MRVWFTTVTIQNLFYILEGLFDYIMKSTILLFIYISMNAICGNTEGPGVAAEVSQSDDEIMLEYCGEGSRLASCIPDHEVPATMEDVLSMIPSNYDEISRECNGVLKNIRSCFGNCVLYSRASKYGYLVTMCHQKMWIDLGHGCWTENFVGEAGECYSRYYPSHRLERTFPVPYRVYDRHAIERECFPSAQAAGEKCPYFQSLLLLRLMPQYWEFHDYPGKFDDNDWYIGYPDFAALPVEKKM